MSRIKLTNFIISSSVSTSDAFDNEVEVAFEGLFVSFFVAIALVTIEAFFVLDDIVAADLFVPFVAIGVALLSLSLISLPFSRRACLILTNASLLVA